MAQTIAKWHYCSGSLPCRIMNMFEIRIVEMYDWEAQVAT